MEYLKKRISEPTLNTIKYHESNKKIKSEKVFLANKSHGFNEIIPVVSKNCNILNNGKSDFFSQSNINLKLIPEPVSLWQNLNGYNLLDLMYKDPKRWSFAFHSYVQLTMLKNHLDLRKSINSNQNDENIYSINIMERSLYSAKYCFVENLFKSNLLQPVEYEILDKWFNWMIKNNECDLDIIFYLRTAPETCFKRLKNRARSEETSQVTLEYIKSLHMLHDNWLYYDNAINSYSNDQTLSMYKPTSIIIIDADKNIEEVYAIIENETKNVIYADAHKD